MFGHCKKRHEYTRLCGCERVEWEFGKDWESRLYLNQGGFEAKWDPIKARFWRDAIRARRKIEGRDAIRARRYTEGRDAIQARRNT